MASQRFQIISDLHLETPIQTPAYSYFSTPANFPLIASNLFLLGDIGLVSHTQPLLLFLRSLLKRDANLKIFYVLGNHEPYHMTLENAVTKMKDWEALLTSEFGPRFFLLNRKRIDLSPQLTILGCTLWTKVPDEHAQEVARSLKDFDDKIGIWDRSLDDHNADHARDLSWLNAQIQHIEDKEPQREIVILTHHSPTTDPRANSKRFPPDRPLNSGFRTDLNKEKCWTSPSVKVWAFGHTHFSCQFVDRVDPGIGEGSEERRRKLVVANQKGYAYAEGMGNWKIEPVVIGKIEGAWKVVVGEESNGGRNEEGTGKKMKMDVRGEVSENTSAEARE